jgi:hypothetical protein
VFSRAPAPTAGTDTTPPTASALPRPEPRVEPKPTAPALSEAEIAAGVAPSVVQVLTEDESKHGGEPEEGRASGVKIAEGIITNDHVVGDAESVQVVAPDGRRSTATVVRRAAVLDLVLLQTDLEVPAVTLEGASGQRRGETVLVLGYPRPDALGDGEDVTLTRGLVSAIRQDHEGVTYIQTDAGVDPGSSGGAMVNLRGRLIGIPTFGVRGSRSLNFAVSADAVQALLRMPTPGPAPAGPLYGGDPRDVPLEPDDLGPGWKSIMDRMRTDERANAGGEGLPASAATELVRENPADPAGAFAALLSRVWVQEDAQRAQILWERTIRHAPGGLTRLADPNVADGCRAYTRTEGDRADLHVLCREENVVVARMQGTRDIATYDAITFYTGIMTERVRNASR